MARLKAEYGYDHTNQSVLVLRKARGKITIAEIEEFLRYEQGGRYQGRYAVFLNATESSCGGSGWMDEIDPPGDVVSLYPMEDGGECPCCRRYLVMDSCPHCGEDLHNTSNL
jgi:hypothetical protein